MGHISVPHTLRRNVRYEGIPFNPVLRNHHETRRGSRCFATLV